MLPSVVLTVVFMAVEHKDILAYVRSRCHVHDDRNDDYTSNTFIVIGPLYSDIARCLFHFSMSAHSLSFLEASHLKSNLDIQLV